MAKRRKKKKVKRKKVKKEEEDKLNLFFYNCPPLQIWEGVFYCGIIRCF